jgi:hypothetical protein
LNFIINYTVYPFDLMFSFGQTDKELRAELKKINGIKIGSDYKFEDGEDGKYVYWVNGFTLIRLRCIPKEAYHFGVLQHEIFHAITCLMDHVGMKLTDESNESYAYLIGYATTEVYERIFNAEKTEVCQTK